MALKALPRSWVLLPALFVLFVLFGFLMVSEAQARNTYEMQENSEGDPGDGVLRPSPHVIDPIPGPHPRLFDATMTVSGDLSTPLNRSYIILPTLFHGQIFAYRLLPAIDLPAFMHVRQVNDGRWTHAP